MSKKLDILTTKYDVSDDVYDERNLSHLTQNAINCKEIDLLLKTGDMHRLLNINIIFNRQKVDFPKMPERLESKFDIEKNDWAYPIFLKTAEDNGISVKSNSFCRFLEGAHQCGFRAATELFVNTAFVNPAVIKEGYFKSETVLDISNEDNGALKVVEQVKVYTTNSDLEIGIDSVLVAAFKTTYIVNNDKTITYNNDTSVDINSKSPSAIHFRDQMEWYQKLINYISRKLSGLNQFALFYLNNSHASETKKPPSTSNAVSSSEEDGLTAPAVNTTNPSTDSETDSPATPEGKALCNKPGR